LGGHPRRNTASDGTNDKEQEMADHATTSGHQGVLTGFKDFILRGNVVELAVAFVIGAAFGKVITALVNDILTPLIGAIFGSKGAFEDLSFSINHSAFLYGDLIDSIIGFIAVAAAIYFVVVLPLNKLAERRARGIPEPDSDLRPCPECLSEIPKAATRCMACTALVGAA
jgi:large conductance mechanosensitive channel